MGQWCNCIECVGDQPEPTEEELKAMDQTIQRIHEEDIILWPNGGWSYRRDAALTKQETESKDFEVIPINSPQWITLRSAWSDQA